MGITLLLSIFSLYYLFCLIWLIGYSESINNSKRSIFNKICIFILITIVAPLLFPLALGASMSNINKVREELEKIKKTKINQNEKISKLH